MSAKIRKVLGVMLLIGVALVVVLFMPLYAWVKTIHSSDAKVFAARQVEAIQQFLQEHSSVIAQMGSDPDSAVVFGNLVELWGKQKGVNTSDAQREITVTFPNENLGLYALNAFLTTGDPDETERLKACRFLVHDYPDTRVACMALEHLLSVAPDEGNSLNEQLAKVTDTRLSRFALVTMGEKYAQRGESVAAAIAWLKAWRAQPDMGSRVYNGICTIWLERGEWLTPLVIGTEHLDDPVLNTFKDRQLEYFQADVGDSERTRVLGAIRKATEGSRLDELCDEVEKITEGWDKLQLNEGEKAELTVGVFLLGSPSEHTLSVANKLALKNRFDSARQRILTLGEQSFLTQPAELRGFYVMRVADRMGEDVRPKNAMAILERNLNDEKMPSGWRELLFSRYANIMALDNRQPKKAAEAYVEYCKDHADAPAVFFGKSGLLFLEVRDYANAKTQFESLEKNTKVDSEKALATFMVGFCNMNLGDDASAKEYFQKVIDRYSQTEFGPKAFAQLGTIAIKENDREKARQCFQEITARYPDWENTKYYEQMTKSLSAAE